MPQAGVQTLMASTSNHPQALQLATVPLRLEMIASQSVLALKTYGLNALPVALATESGENCK